MNADYMNLNLRSRQILRDSAVWCCWSSRCFCGLIICAADSTVQGLSIRGIPCAGDEGDAETGWNSPYDSQPRAFVAV